MPCHAARTLSLSLSLPITRHEYFFVFHFALRFASLSAFNWKLSMLRKKNWVFFTLVYKFHFFLALHLVFVFPFRFRFVFLFIFWLLFVFGSYEICTPFSPHNFTSIRFRRYSMALYCLCICAICCEITV